MSDTRFVHVIFTHFKKNSTFLKSLFFYHDNMQAFIKKMAVSISFEVWTQDDKLFVGNLHGITWEGKLSAEQTLVGLVARFQCSPCYRGRDE